MDCRGLVVEKSLRVTSISMFVIGKYARVSFRISCGLALVYHVQLYLFLFYALGFDAIVAIRAVVMRFLT